MISKYLIYADTNFKLSLIWPDCDETRETITIVPLNIEDQTYIVGDKN